MPKKVNDITKLIGDTPIVRLNKIVHKESATVWGKCEFFNPAFSVKDRIGLSMIKDAEEKGVLKKGDTIIEPTSGNTGNGLAFVAAQRGYNLILVIPDFVSLEKRALLKAYGAKVIVVKEEKEGVGMIGAVNKAKEISKKFGYFMPQQFKNIAVPRIHFETTGPEIVEAFKDTRLDYFVAGVGTGGTITGAGQILKKHFPNIKIIAVEPKGSSVLSGGKPGSHKIQGIGPGFIPDVLDSQIYDQIIPVSYDDAKGVARRMAKEEGILVGISAGAITYAGLQIAKGKNKNKQMLVILPDSGERYLSTDLFSD